MKGEMPNPRLSGAEWPPRVAIISRIPNPYRSPVYDLLNTEGLFNITVLYCAALEPNRQWILPDFQARSIVLKRRILRLGENRYLHFNFDVWARLRELRPGAVVTNGYGATDLIAFTYAVIHRIPHVSHTDGTLESEARLGFLHRIVRRVVSTHTSTYIGPGAGSTRLYLSWGIPNENIFVSQLAVDNNKYAHTTISPCHDLVFSGRLTETKNPLFVVRIAAEAARRVGRPVSVRFIGDGPLRSDVEQLAREMSVPVTLCGFVQQDDLPAAYAGASVFVMPTKWDPWGLVVNEAAAAGLPLLVSDNAGAGEELVITNVNGARLPLVESQWVEALIPLLQNATLREQFGEASRAIVAPYSWQESARGYSAALAHAIKPYGG